MRGSVETMREHETDLNSTEAVKRSDTLHLPRSTVSMLCTTNTVLAEHATWSYTLQSDSVHAAHGLQSPTGSFVFFRFFFFSLLTCCCCCWRGSSGLPKLVAFHCLAGGQFPLNTAALPSSSPSEASASPRTAAHMTVKDYNEQQKSLRAVC